MEQKKENKVRLVYRRSSLAVKCIILTAILLCSGVLVWLGISIKINQQKAAEAKAKAAQLVQEQERLEQNIDELGTPQSTQRIAGEELGLVDPDTIIFETTETTE